MPTSNLLTEVLLRGVAALLFPLLLLLLLPLLFLEPKLLLLPFQVEGRAATLGQVAEIELAALPLPLVAKLQDLADLPPISSQALGIVFDDHG